MNSYADTPEDRKRKKDGELPLSVENKFKVENAYITEQTKINRKIEEGTIKEQDIIDAANNVDIKAYDEWLAQDWDNNRRALSQAAARSPEAHEYFKNLKTAPAPYASDTFASMKAHGFTGIGDLFNEWWDGIKSSEVNYDLGSDTDTINGFINWDQLGKDLPTISNHIPSNEEYVTAVENKDTETIRRYATIYNSFAQNGLTRMFEPFTSEQEKRLALATMGYGQIGWKNLSPLEKNILGGMAGLGNGLSMIGMGSNLNIESFDPMERRRAALWQGLNDAAKKDTPLAYMYGRHMGGGYLMDAASFPLIAVKNDLQAGVDRAQGKPRQWRGKWTISGWEDTPQFAAMLRQGNKYKVIDEYLSDPRNAALVNLLGDAAFDPLTWTSFYAIGSAASSSKMAKGLQSVDQADDGLNAAKNTNKLKNFIAEQGRDTAIAMEANPAIFNEARAQRIAKSLSVKKILPAIDAADAAKLGRIDDAVKMADTTADMKRMFKLSPDSQLAKGTGLLGDVVKTAKLGAVDDIADASKFADNLVDITHSRKSSPASLNKSALAEASKKKRPMNLNDTGILNTKNKVVQRTGLSRTIKGVEAEVISNAVGLKPGMKLPERIYVETDNFNSIVKYEPVDIVKGLDYYKAESGNVGRIYEPVARANGKLSYRDVTQKADGKLLLNQNKRRTRIVENKAKGDYFELIQKTILEADHDSVVTQITVKTDGGVRTRIDFFSKDKASGDIILSEAKSSDTAPLTRNQKLAFPEIAQNGAIVIGKGKFPYTGGLRIPPTKVEIIRPNK